MKPSFNISVVTSLLKGPSWSTFSRDLIRSYSLLSLDINCKHTVYNLKPKNCLLMTPLYDKLGGIVMCVKVHMRVCKASESPCSLECSSCLFSAEYI